MYISLIHQQPLKMQPKVFEQSASLTRHDDVSWTNRMIHLLAQILSIIYTDTADRLPKLMSLQAKVEWWMQNKPCYFEPIHKLPRDKHSNRRFPIMLRILIICLPLAKATSMHDLRALRDDPAGYDRNWARRGLGGQAAELLALDERRRAAQTEMQVMLQQRNEKSKLIGQLKAQGADAQGSMDEVAAMKLRVAELEQAEATLSDQLNDRLASLPNLSSFLLQFGQTVWTAAIPELESAAVSLVTKLVGKVVDAPAVTEAAPAVAA